MQHAVMNPTAPLNSTPNSTKPMRHPKMNSIPSNMTRELSDFLKMSSTTKCSGEKSFARIYCSRRRVPGSFQGRIVGGSAATINLGNWRSRPTSQNGPLFSDSHQTEVLRKSFPVTGHRLFGSPLRTGPHAEPKISEYGERRARPNYSLALDLRPQGRTA